MYIMNVVMFHTPIPSTQHLLSQPNPLLLSFLFLCVWNSLGLFRIPCLGICGRLFTGTWPAYQRLHHWRNWHLPPRGMRNYKHLEEKKIYAVIKHGILLIFLNITTSFSLNKTNSLTIYFFDPLNCLELWIKHKWIRKIMTHCGTFYKYVKNYEKSIKLQ